MVGIHTVAVIDDDPDIAGIIAELLTDEHYQPVLWHTGRGAYEFIKREQPLAVILDMRMETPDAGLRVAEALASDPETMGIPVIMCTGEHEYIRKNRQRLQGLSFRILGKPFSIPGLLAMLNQATLSQRFNANRMSRELSAGGGGAKV